jgi:hypothetical protein
MIKISKRKQFYYVRSRLINYHLTMKEIYVTVGDKGPESLSYTSFIFFQTFGHNFQVPKGQSSTGFKLESYTHREREYSECECECRSKITPTCVLIFFTVGTVSDRVKVLKGGWAPYNGLEPPGGSDPPDGSDPTGGMNPSSGSDSPGDLQNSENTTRVGRHSSL